ncbi:hypothetical protein CBL_06100 [Carabus blaptoides fortunei]
MVVMLMALESFYFAAPIFVSLHKCGYREQCGYVHSFTNSPLNRTAHLPPACTAADAADTTDGEFSRRARRILTRPCVLSRRKSGLLPIDHSQRPPRRSARGRSFIGCDVMVPGHNRTSKLKDLVVIDGGSGTGSTTGRVKIDRYNTKIITKRDETELERYPRSGTINQVNVLRIRSVAVQVMSLFIFHPRPADVERNLIKRTWINSSYVKSVPITTELMYARPRELYRIVS